jgi:hypothetical protein
MQTVDGLLLGLKPGAVICLSAASKYGAITFKNLVGTPTAPIVITNCGGTATMDATGRPFNLKTETSKYIKISGGTGTTYGLRLIGGHMGMTLQKFTTDFEINNLEIFNQTFAGIQAKTDPSCDDATLRGNFTMRNVSIHNNYIHDTKGEALYIGHTFYHGYETSCGVRLPHLIENVRIYQNKIVNPGWDGIQVSCALDGAHVYDNTITNYGVMNEPVQNSGIQISSGTAGVIYRNIIKGGTGPGINIIGHGDSFIHDNIIMNTGGPGMFLDERTAVNLPGFRIINNTIINTKGDGIRNYGDQVPNVMINNIIINPGTNYSYPRTPDHAYIYLLNKTMKVDTFNNYKTKNIAYLKFVSPATDNYRLLSSSPAVDRGKDISAYKILTDVYNQVRKSGSAYDIGASEFMSAGSGSEEPVETNVAPVADAGAQQFILLPASTATIIGSATDSDGTIASSSWTKVSGPSATMSGATTSTLKLSGLTAGRYVFRFTVKDNDGATDTDDVAITVSDAPKVSAGADKTVTLPIGSVTFTATASDADGIASYMWYKASGPSVSMSNVSTKTVTLSALVKGTYSFRVAVKDNLGVVGHDYVTLIVK